MAPRARPLRDATERRRALFELALLILGAALAFVVTKLGSDSWLERVAGLSPESAPTEAAVRGAARNAALLFAAGVACLAAARAFALRRARDPLPAFCILPALVGLCLLGLTLHTATVEGSSDRILMPTSAHFASGFFFGCVAGATLLALPRDPAALASRLKLVLVVGIVAVFILLGIFGSGPGRSDARIELGTIQPIETVKAAFVVFLAAYLGERAAKLRWQRVRFAGLRWPRPVLLVPATLVFALLVTALYLVRDLGPTLILVPVFIGLFYLGTRASGAALIALCAVAGGLLALALAPELAGSGLVGTRIVMWLDPWTNALTHGHQLGEALWSSAAGGAFGQGLAGAHVPGPPEAKTDLILALLMEQLGFAGLALYLVLLAILSAGALSVAAGNRTPERVLMAAGVPILLVVQWAIIHAGTLGALPLSGVVAPFLSTGRSSMIVFVALVALVVRLSEDGRARAPSAELRELRPALGSIGIVLLVVIAVGAGLGVYRTLIAARETSARGILIELADGTMRHRHNPRITELSETITRGSILGRRGTPLAEGGSPARPAARSYPLGPALGTLLGVPPGGICLPWWPLERRFDETLRGYPERDDPPGTRIGCRGREAIPSPDFRDFAPLLRLPRDERRAALREVAGDIESRSMTISIDARLQRTAQGILRGAVEGSPGRAAAAAVVEVDSGEILARVQVPDYDPGEGAWRARLREREPEITGAYGALPDKTGLRGLYQAGSVAKLVTALAAARQGVRFEGRGCDLRAEPTFACEETSGDRPSFSLPHWSRPIRDFPGDPTHGSLDIPRALAKSCNVYFGQLALSLGPEPFFELVKRGVEIGPYDREGKNAIRPGAAESRRLAESGYGQGGAWMNVVQAARLTAAIGAGGVYRRCPASMELGGACEETRITRDPEDVEPILAGMRAVMEAGGTGERLSQPSGLRVYGKTGTADAPGFAGEEPFGIPRGADAPPHSWFVALAESEGAPACGRDVRGRIALAVVVPRGGSGARVAGPAAMAILEEAAALGYTERAP